MPRKVSPRRKARKHNISFVGNVRITKVGGFKLTTFLDKRGELLPDAVQKLARKLRRVDADKCEYFKLQIGRQTSIFHGHEKDGGRGVDYESGLQHLILRLLRAFSGYSPERVEGVPIVKILGFGNRAGIRKHREHVNKVSRKLVEVWARRKARRSRIRKVISRRVGALRKTRGAERAARNAKIDYLDGQMRGVRRHIMRLLRTEVERTRKALAASKRRKGRHER